LLPTPAPVVRSDESAEPVSRIQVIVNLAHSYDDHGGALSGSGEIELFPDFRTP
jgi:hypothetical protein